MTFKDSCGRWPPRARPSELLILDALGDLDIHRQSNETMEWHQCRLLEALKSPIDFSVVWAPSG